MLLIVAILFLFIGIGFKIIGNKDWYPKIEKNSFYKFLYYNDDDISSTGGFITFISVIALIVMFILSCIYYSDARATVSQLSQKYNALIYKATEKDFRDDFGILNKSIIDEVQQWNEELAYNQALQYNFWVGNLIPNIYDQFEFIEYKEFVGE